MAAAAARRRLVTTAFRPPSLQCRRDRGARVDVSPAREIGAGGSTSLSPLLNSAVFKMARRRWIQQELRARTWGGRRDGAGRKRRPGRRPARHVARPKLASRFPVHVTKRVVAGVPKLRSFKLAPVLRACFVRGCARPGFRICQFSIQGNHLHLVCEAKDATALARGIQGWSVRVARAINARLGREGRLFEERYHSEVLASPRQVRHALCYVLHNARRQGATLDPAFGGVDPFSSAWHFDGWRERGWRCGLAPPSGDSPVAPAHTWLLRVGWRRWGLIDVGESPAAAATR
jgi:REP element-mobilizing transposase RayT